MTKFSFVLILGILILSGFILTRFLIDRGDDIQVGTVGEPTSTSSVNSAIKQQLVSDKEVLEIKNIIIENTRQNIPNIQTGEIFVYSTYAFQVWYDDNLGGEALLKKEGDKWVLVSIGGGAWEDYSLVELGVPKDIATEMVRRRPY